MDSLQQLSPVLAAITFLSTSTFLLLLPRKGGFQTYAIARPHHKRLSWTSVAVCLSFAAEAILYFGQAHVQDRYWPSKPELSSVLSFTLLWTCLSVSIFEFRAPLWLAYISTWTTTATIDLVLLAFQADSQTPGSAWHIVRSSIRAARVLLLLASIIWATLSGRRAHVGDATSSEETQGLLTPSSSRRDEANDASSSSTYGSAIDTYDGFLSDDEDEDEDDKEIKEAMRARLRDQGGWLGYLKGFSIFLPHIIPYKSRRTQLWVGVMVICVVVQRTLTVAIPLQLGTVTDLLGNAQGLGTVPWKQIAIWGLLQFPGATVTEMFEDFASTRLSQFAYAQLKAAAFGHVMNLSMDYHSSKSSGKLSKAIDQGTDVTAILENIFSAGPMLVDLVIAAIYLTSYFDYCMGLIVLATTLAHIYVAVKGNAIATPMKRASGDKERVESEVLYDSISNWQTVAYHNRNKFEQDRFTQAVIANTTAQTRYYDYANYVYLGQYFTLDAGLVAAASLAAYRVAQGTEPLSSFVFLVAYWISIREPMAVIAWTFRQMAAHLINAEWLFQLLQTKPSIQDRDGAEALDVTAGTVDFHGVSFRYTPDRQILKDVSFSARGGETVAFVGETGSGKSTLMKLLFRFWDVEAGGITIDGQDIRDVKLRSLRELLGIVPQDPSLFDQTIMQNIRYARPAATDEEVHEACRAACIHDQIRRFPRGYDTRIGERGVKLSGGEAQRLAIARVILRKPRIVVLDEATSAVDSDTEASVQQALRTLSRGRTVFVVAHRLSTIVGADQILVMDQGRVVERGTHDELLDKKGKYAGLWSMQTRSHPSEAPHDLKLVD